MQEWIAASVLILSATLRVATPLILCAMGGLFSERSGVIDVGLEGKMLAGAFAAAAAASLTGSAWIGLGAAVLTAIALAGLHGLAAITYAGNQVVSGVAINIIVSGLTIVFGEAWFHQGGQTPPLSPEARFLPLQLPGADSIAQVSVLGPIYARLISGNNLIVYAALLSVPIVHWIIRKTRFGLRLRAVGEAPQALDTAGISVAWLRYRAVLVCGMFTGVAGAYLSLAQNAGFSRDMSAGQGYIALAALITGKWTPYGALAACLMFGLLDAVAIRLQGVRPFGLGELPVQLIQVLPYVLTILLLAGFVGRAVAPKAIGIPYRKEP